jgi:hypothetical protein
MSSNGESDVSSCEWPASLPFPAPAVGLRACAAASAEATTIAAVKRVTRNMTLPSRYLRLCLKSTSTRRWQRAIRKCNGCYLKASPARRPLPTRVHRVRRCRFLGPTFTTFASTRPQPTCALTPPSASPANLTNVDKTVGDPPNSIVSARLRKAAGISRAASR